VFKRHYRGIGTIRRLSGTLEKGTLADIRATMDRLFENGDFDLKRRVRDGEIKPIDVFRYGRIRAPAKPTRQPYIYILRARPSGNLKIGIAVDVDRRLCAAQTHTWETLTVAFMMPGWPEDEKRLHHTFREHHIAREWFRPGPEILAWIEENAE
jgi:hypothetical protein